VVPDKMNPLAWLRKHLDDEGGNDLIREMVKAFAEQLMSAEADALCGAGVSAMR
jgi:transposase-like protein